MKNFSSFVKWAFVAAFIIVTNLFIYYAIDLIQPEPKYETFCPIRNESFVTPESCVAAGGQWTNHQLSPKETTQAVKDGQPLGWCDPDVTCRGVYEDSTSIYNRNVFIAMIIISTVLVVGGMIIPVEVLSLGLAWSGVVGLIIATIRYWSDANNVIKVLILGIAIAVLTWLAVKKMNKADKA